MLFLDVTFTSGATHESSPGSNIQVMTMDMPAVVEAGDLLVLFGVGAKYDFRSFYADTSIWTLAANASTNGGLNGLSVTALYYRIAVGTEGGTTFDGGVGTPGGAAFPTPFIAAVARYSVGDLTEFPGTEPWSDGDPDNTLSKEGVQGGQPAGTWVGPPTTVTLSPIYYPSTAADQASSVMAFAYYARVSEVSVSYNGPVPMDSADLADCVERGRETISDYADSFTALFHHDLTLIVADVLNYTVTQPDASAEFSWTDTPYTFGDATVAHDSPTLSGIKGVFGHLEGGDAWAWTDGGGNAWAWVG